MKNLFFCIVLLLAGGCFSGYRQTVEIDLTRSELPGQRIMPSARIGVIRNNSGAGLPLMIRHKDGLVETDKYARWILSPEQLLERELHRTLTATDAPAVRLSGNVLTCEFDAVRKEAILEVSFEAKKNKVFRQIRKTFCVPVAWPQKNDPVLRASALSKAMSECFQKACFAAADLIEEVQKTHEI